MFRGVMLPQIETRIKGERGIVALPAGDAVIMFISDVVLEVVLGEKVGGTLRAGVMARRVALVLGQRCSRRQEPLAAEAIQLGMSW